MARTSPLAWGRGSKHGKVKSPVQLDQSPLAWGRGSKLSCAYNVGGIDQSPLAWGRGSKQRLFAHRSLEFMSPLAWGRGSKLLSRLGCTPAFGRPSRGGVDRNIELAREDMRKWRRPSRGGVDRNTSRSMSLSACVVAPRVGAWIETGIRDDSLIRGRSPLAWGRGSKHGGQEDGQSLWSRPSRGGVDRNPATHVAGVTYEGRPSRGGVDRNYTWTSRRVTRAVAPRVGAWIETTKPRRRP